MNLLSLCVRSIVSLFAISSYISKQIFIKFSLSESWDHLGKFGTKKSGKNPEFGKYLDFFGNLFHGVGSHNMWLWLLCCEGNRNMYQGQTGTKYHDSDQLHEAQLLRICNNSPYKIYVLSTKVCICTLIILLSLAMPFLGPQSSHFSGWTVGSQK